MTHFEHVKEVFLAACDLESDERAAYLDDACAGDAGLRAEVERLLEEDAAPLACVDHALASPGAIVDAVTGAATPPERLGAYRILRIIGEGGMGVVYAAEQDEPRRRVALKVIRPGHVNRELLRRFRHEAQVLGQLRHPGIAQIYDAGTADTGAGGQPWFAMELVDGLPLLEFAEHHALDTHDRLELVARICDALHHAHQKGVIHRDLKPGNILVETAAPGTSATGTAHAGGMQPKILDFGVARITDADIQTVTMRTDVGQLVGTLPYMSPEQAAGDPSALDVRSDIYTVGVILFQLLTGRLPYAVEGCMIHEAVRVIREQEPSRLSVYQRRLRGDVETIVAKALEKEPDRRYASAAELAADLRRHLADQPIVARPASSLYQLRKFARRNRAIVTGVVVAFAAMLVGTVLALGEAHRARVAEADAALQGRLANERAGALDEAVWRTYRTAIASASSALDDDDPIDSGRFLALAPEALRGWEHRHLVARLDATAATFVTDASTRAARFDDDGRVVTVTETSLLQTWDADRRSVLREARLDAPIPSLRPTRGARSAPPALFSDDGTTLLAAVGVGDEPRSIVLFDVADGRRRAELAPEQITEALGRSVKLTSLAVSDDARRVALGGPNGALLWDPDTGGLRKLGRRGQSALAFGMHGTRLVRAFLDGGGRVVVEDSATGAGIHRPFRNGIYRIDTVALAGDGGRLLFGSEDALATVIELENHGQHVLRGHTRPVTAAALDPSGRWMATGSADHTVRVWEARTGALHAVLADQSGAITIVAFDRNGSRLLTVADRSVRVYELPIRRDVVTLGGHEPAAVYGVQHGGDGTLVSVDFGGTLRFRDAGTGIALGALPTGARRALALAASPAGSLVATAHENGLIGIRDLRSGALVRELRCSGRTRVNALDCDPSGTRLVARTRRHVDVWNFRTGEHLAAIPATGRRLAGAIAISADGRFVAADVEGGFGIWNAETGAIAYEVSSRGQARSLEFSPDGQVLAVGKSQGHVLLCDGRTGAVRHELDGHTDKVYALAFSPDGDRLASGGDDRTIILWDVARGSSVLTLRGHQSFVYALDFAPDGNTLYSGSGEGTIGVWSTTPFSERSHAATLLEQRYAQARPLVERLLAEHDRDPCAVADRLQSDPSLADDARRAALQVNLARALRTDGEATVAPADDAAR